MQQRATEWNRTLGGCSEDTASVHGAPALPTEPTGRPSITNIYYKNTKVPLDTQTHTGSNPNFFRHLSRINRFNFGKNSVSWSVRYVNIHNDKYMLKICKYDLQQVRGWFAAECQASRMSETKWNVKWRAFISSFSSPTTTQRAFTIHVNVHTLMKEASIWGATVTHTHTRRPMEQPSGAV